MDIIAELGSNPAPHGWPLEDYVQAAALTGATSVKVQCFRAEHFPEWAQAEKRKVEFPRARLGEFARLAHAYGLAAGASVFDAEAVELCAQELDFLKLAAREQHDYGLGCLCMHSGKRLYRSISEDKAFMDYGYTYQGGAVLWAIQKYPAGMIESILTLLHAARLFKSHGKRWGWSSHTRGWLDVTLAARLGASVAEKHFALSADDPEAGHSPMPAQFKRMVKRINGK